MIAAVATMLMFITLTAYAIHTDTDLTKFGGFICVGSVMLIFMLICLFAFNLPSIFGPIFFCILMALLSMWIVHDT